MNLFEKINIIKENILKSNLKKSGKNKFAGFEYYELSDFLPTIIKNCKEHKIFTNIFFNNDLATLKIINVENTSEVIEYTSPMRNLELKGCNEIQALGGVETYQRRYLLMCAFDIIENDLFDSQEHNSNNNNNKLTKERIKEVFPDAIILPTQEQITNYIAEKEYYNVKAIVFYDYYNKQGWKDKNGKSIDYKKMIDYWEVKNKEKKQE